MKRFTLKCISAILALTMLIPSVCLSSFAAEQNASLQKLTGTTFVTAQENALYKLCVKPDTGDFYIEEKASGNKVYSTPAEAESDTVAKGYNLMTLQSCFEITYISKAQVTDMTNSLVSSVRKSGLSVYKLNDGIKLCFEMPEIKITLPIEVKLLEDSFEVSVIVPEIKEEGDYKLLTVTLLPFLGAASAKESGWLLLPDGCGALVDFEAGAATPNSNTYRKAVYSGNAVNSAISVVTKTAALQLPVFGIAAEGRGLLGIITQGDYDSDIEAYYKGGKSGYSTVHPIFRYRGTTTRTLFDSSWDRKKVTIVAESPAEYERYSVRYYCFNEADYSVMAKKTAEYYGGLSKQRKASEATVSIRVPAAVRKADSFLGIPIKKAYALNDYEDLKKLTQKLQKAGLEDLNVFYSGCFSGGLYDSMPVSARPESKLGSKKELKKLISELDKKGISLYPEADLSRIYKNGNGVWQNLNGSRDFSGGVNFLSDYSPVTTYSATIDPIKYTVLRATKYQKIYSKFVKGLGKNGFEGFVDIGTDAVSSDNPHSKKATDAYSARLLQEKAIKNAVKKTKGYIVKNAAAYLLEYVTGICDVPFSSSRVDGFSREIPFYTLVSSRFAASFATALNDEESTADYLLRCLEYGLLPSAYISLNDTSVIAETLADSFYAADADRVTKRLAEIAKNADGLLEVIANNALVEHSNQNGVFVSTYSDGTAIYGNYNDTVATVNEVTIEPNSYKVIKGRAQQ